VPRADSLLDRRAQAVLAAAAATGAVVGLVIAGFERLADRVLLHAVLAAPLWVQAGAPALGLAIAVLLVPRLTGDRATATADEYVAAFHDRRGGIALRLVPGRLAAGLATIGSGGALGLEGPSIYAGGAIGTAMQRRLGRLFRRDETKILLVAGAAAGVAAVFRAPATGVVFALEVPYTDDVARRALLPALVASAASYLVYVSLVTTRPLFGLGGEAADLRLRDLGGALLLGVLAGAGARLFSLLVRHAKRMADTTGPWARVVVGGAVLGGLAVLTEAVFEHPLSLGPGYEVIEWAADPTRALGLVALLFAVRMMATATTLGAGGTGGLFIPLAVQGVLLGRFVSDLTGSPDPTLFPVIGLAAFLGAGYRTPLASVMFVAETSGRALYVVPALVAAALSQLFMSGASVSAKQQSGRAGHLERRLRLPLTSALTTDVLTVPSDATVGEFIWVHVVGRRERVVPVVDGGRYLGMCRLEESAALPRDEWDTTQVAQTMRDDLPVALPSWSLRDVVAAMEDADVDRLAVVDAEGAFVGLVLAEEIVKLHEVLDETGG
jgi:chloride channel protein, CIC family